MGSAQLTNPEGTRNKDLPDIVSGGGQGLCKENESRNQDASKDFKNSQTRDDAPLVRQPSGSRNQQPQPPGQIICWERFLPVRTLKVLLVENDDSTRHVVSALLCNCSYEVTAVANGLQAWRILQDLTNRIDLVLTEVIMPGLNGIGLLNKIMNHKTCKIIPVIMMSSHDSMGIVFKCLSKGAVDFLVKPIRKNELRNLWQHVWRRCHSSSDSGSESGTQTQKSVKSKNLDDSDNSSGSNNDETASIDLNARDSSDIGSGTQSSWTKRAAEVSSPQPMSSSNQLVDPLDSTCALVIHTTDNILCKDHMPTSANREKQDKKEPSDDCMGNDTENGECKNWEKQCQTPLTEQDSIKQTGKEVDRLPEKGSKKECCLGTLSTNILNEPIALAANLIGAIASSFDSEVVSRVIQCPSGFSKASLDQDKVNCTLSDSASIELSLKRLRSISETRTSTQDERNPKRLDLSAFSRYNKSDASNQPQMGYGRSCSPLDNSTEAIMLNTAPLRQGSNVSSNNNDMGSTTKNTFKKPLGMKEMTAPTSIVKCIHNSASYSVQFRTLENQDHLQRSVENLTAPSAAGKGKEIQHQVPPQHHHLHHSNPHHYHYVHSIQQPTPDQNDLILKNKAEEPLSSNVFNGSFDGNAANYSVNGSNSGSNHGSNGNIDNNNAIQTGGSRTESANAIVEQSGSGSGNGSRSSSSGSGADQNPLTHREAALKKFREKRKERNYGKMVRYQSRKRLAEQRPRVHGQFARKSVHEQTSGDADR